MNNRSNKLLFDVLTACREITSFLTGKTRDDYLKDSLLRRAVERDLEIVGEAMSQLRALDAGTFARIPEGSRIIGMRNRLIHTYTDVSDEIVWDTARHDLPELQRVVEEMLDA
jgi:uncharacterized protein with HEPN domain